MARNSTKTIRSAHLTAEKPGDERLVISARVELFGYQFSEHVKRVKEKLANDLHAFAVAQGYSPTRIRFYSTRQ